MTPLELIEKMQDTPQHPVYHPEGNVLIHSIKAADIMLQLTTDLSERESRMLVMTAFLHDVGKTVTTDPVTFTAHGHAAAGVEIARPLLENMNTFTDEERAIILKLINHHMDVYDLPRTPRAVGRLSVKLFPATLEQLVLVNTADVSSRGLGFKTPAKNILKIDISGYLEQRLASQGR